jgi:proteasome lid subunit RPN8/RPN11
MSQNAQPSNYVDKSKVFIQSTAYIKMKKHCLRYASPYLPYEEFSEVMGMLFGKLEDGDDKNLKDVHIMDAVPVSHGSSIEVGFSMQDYANIAMLDVKYADQGLFCVGWYHSHPGLTCFFSSVDKRNQLGFQAQNPSAIGLVFDHERFLTLKDHGFDVYRLDDPSIGVKSKYHEVQSKIVHSGYFIDYILDLKSIIDSSQRGEPFVMELSEVLDIFGNMQMPRQKEIKVDMPVLDVPKILKELNQNKSSSKIEQENLEFVLNTFSNGFSDLNTVINNFKSEVLKKLTQFKEEFGAQFQEVQSWAKTHLNSQIESVNQVIRDNISETNSEESEV